MAAPLSRARRYVLLSLILCGFGVVLSRLVTLQVLQAAELTVKADRQHQKTVALEGARGAIVDRHGKMLAMNLEVPSIFGVPTVLDSPAKTARSLSPVLHVRIDELEVPRDGFTVDAYAGTITFKPGTIVNRTNVVQDGRNSGRFESIDATYTAASLLGHGDLMKQGLASLKKRPGILVEDILR